LQPTRITADINQTIMAPVAPVFPTLASSAPDLPPINAVPSVSTAFEQKLDDARSGIVVPHFSSSPTNERKFRFGHPSPNLVPPYPFSPQMPKRSSAFVVILLVFLAIAPMSALILGFVNVSNQTRITNANATAVLIANGNDNATATSVANAEATAIAITRDSATATAAANNNAAETAAAHNSKAATETAAAKNSAAATATANNNATATAVANSNPYGGGGTFVFYDPLTRRNHWSNGSDTSFGGSCQFQSDGYHIKETGSQRFFHCLNDQSFSNFVFEVRMRIIQGDCGGLVWRYMDTHFYKLNVCSDGTYSFYRYASNVASSATKLTSGNIDVSSGVNTLAVVADGGSFTFYLNQKRIGGGHDSDYTSGYIGLISENYTRTTEVVYTDARLWLL
jgi:hypothetical protein